MFVARTMALALVCWVWPIAQMMKPGRFSAIVRAMAAEVGNPIDDTVVREAVDRQYRATIEHAALRDDAVATLTGLRDRGLHTQIVSNIDDEQLQPMVRRMGLDTVLDAWTSSDEAGSCKPDPAIYRLAFAEIHADERAETCAGFLERAIAFYARVGVRVERVITDNAVAYRRSHAFRDVIVAHGISQKFIRPHCPWQNGKVERLNRTQLAEWAYRQAFLTNDDRSAALAPWLEHYNTRRRHSALGGHPPISRLLPT